MIKKPVQKVQTANHRKAVMPKKVPLKSNFKNKQFMENETNGGYGREGFTSQDQLSQNYDSQQNRHADAEGGIQNSGRGQNDSSNASANDSESFTASDPYSTNSNFEDTESQALDANFIDSDELEDDDDFEDEEDDDLEVDEESEDPASDDFRTPGL